MCGAETRGDVECCFVDVGDMDLTCMFLLLILINGYVLHNARFILYVRVAILRAILLIVLLR